MNCKSYFFIDDVSVKQVCCNTMNESVYKVDASKKTQLNLKQPYWFLTDRSTTNKIQEGKLQNADWFAQLGFGICSQNTII